MKKRIVFIVLLCMFLLIVPITIWLISYRRNQTNVELNEFAQNRQVYLDHNKIKYIDTDLLYEGMSRQEVEEEFGQPVDSIGSGVSCLYG